MYDQLGRDWVARFTTLLPENRPRAKSGVSSVTLRSLPMGWALQKPRAGGTRCSSQVKEYLKTRFDAREDSGCKADPEQVAINMKNARNEDKARLVSREEWPFSHQRRIIRVDGSSVWFIFRLGVNSRRIIVEFSRLQFTLDG